MAMTQGELEIKNEERRMKKWNEQHKFINGVDHKQCNKCELYLPANTDSFYLNSKNGIDGLYPYCKKCAVKSSAIWIKENYDKFKEIVRKRDATEEIKMKKRESSKLSREKGFQKEWRQQNKDKVKEYSSNKAKKRTHTITLIQWDSCRLYFNYCCAYCGLTYEEHKSVYKQDLHREHVNDIGENDLSNCIPSCKNCNSQKWEFPFDVWYNEINPFFSLERYDKIMRWISEDYKLYI